LGGLVRLWGSYASGLVVGGVESATATYIGQQYVLVTLFLLIVVVLLVRPRGLGGVLEAARA
jgi:branched-chain amino acid transport system permease protein